MALKEPFDWQGSNRTFTPEGYPVDEMLPIRGAYRFAVRVPFEAPLLVLVPFNDHRDRYALAETVTSAIRFVVGMWKRGMTVTRVGDRERLSDL